MKTEFIFFPRKRLAYRFMFVIFAFGGLYGFYNLMFVTDLNRLEKFVLAPLLILMGIASGSEYFYRGFFEQLVLFPDGLQYHAFGRTIYTQWSGTKRMGNSSKGIYTLNGIFVEYSAPNIRNWVPSIMSRKEIFIPLSEFAENWQDSELGQQIKQHAPQLFSSVEN